MSISVVDSLNTGSNQPITSQPHQNQLNQFNNKHHTSYQPTSSTDQTQLTNLLTNNSSQMNKKNNPSQTQLKTTVRNQGTTTTTNQSTSYRKVFIQRDYTHGTSVRFQTKFPEELEGYIERQHFEYLITTLNCYYDKAEAANLSTFCEGFCACLTAYLIYICMESHYEKYMRKTRDYINEQNDQVWRPRGLFVTDPIDRGLRILEITIGPRAVRNVSIEQFKEE